MNEVDAIFKDIQNNKWDGAFAILQIVGLYLAVPILIALLILRFGFRVKGTLFQIVGILIITGWTYFWAMNIFPKITDMILSVCKKSRWDAFPRLFDRCFQIDSTLSY